MDATKKQIAHEQKLVELRNAVLALSEADRERVLADIPIYLTTLAGCPSSFCFDKQAALDGASSSGEGWQVEQGASGVDFQHYDFVDSSDSVDEDEDDDPVDAGDGDGGW